MLTDDNPWLMYALPTWALLRFAGCQISHCLNLRSNIGPGKLIRQLMLWVSSLQIPKCHLNLQMMMRNGRPFHMRWFAKFLIIIWDLTKIPYQVKHEVQNNISDVDTANQTIGFKPTSLIDVQFWGETFWYDISHPDGRISEMGHPVVLHLWMSGW